MNGEIDPRDCVLCTRLEENMDDIRTVARHYLAAHPTWLQVLAAAITIANAQRLGEVNG